MFSAHDSRYSANLLSSATESYKEAQEQRNASLLEVANSIKQVSSAISDFNTVFKQYVEVEKIKAEAELLSANAKLTEAQTNQNLLRIKIMDLLHEDD